MGKFILKRILIVIPILLAVSIIVFAMLQLVPGDPIRMMMGENAALMTPAEIEEYRVLLGLDKPLHIQYLNTIKGYLHGDMGHSIKTKRAVSSEIAIRIPSTISLALFGMSIAIIFGVIVGIISALNHNGPLDYILSFITMLGVGMPRFWFGLLLMYLFAIKLRWLPVISKASDGIRGLILPGVTLASSAHASIARLVRSGMLEVLQNDYIRTARAKGAKEQTVIIKHALRNSLIPVITVIGVQFGSIVAGTTIIETVFSRQGLGVLLVNAILEKDFPLIQGVMMVVSLVYVVVNALVEIAYGILDPRIRLQ